MLIFIDNVFPLKHEFPVSIEIRQRNGSRDSHRGGTNGVLRGALEQDQEGLESE